MTSRTPVLRIMTGLVAAFALTLVAPSPAHAAQVSLTADRSSSPPTVLVKFSGGATETSAGAVVKLQRQAGASWTTVKSGTVGSNALFSFSVRVATGSYKYRAEVNGTTSPSLTVAGNYGRNISVPAPGAPFTISGQLPVGEGTATSRPVYVLWYTGGVWKQRGGAASSTSGFVAVRTNLPVTSPVRLHAPAYNALPVWYGPMGKITIGSDPRISRILADTNKYRAANGRPALKLHASLNTVAGDWAYRMHQTCTFFHNQKSAGSPTNFWEQYPAGWMAYAENIAYGYTYLTVTPGWINSTGHRANILGNYSHIGIGYYEGPNCGKRYWVQNFAKY